MGFLARFVLAAVLFVAAPAFADEPPPWRHAISRLNSVKYPPDFRHFDYVNPNAPKGGLLRTASFGAFDSFNAVIASVKGQLQGDVTRVYQTLMTASYDEVATYYGLIAEAIRYPDDFSFASFRLHPAARWHDGVPITPEDVIFSMEAFKRLSPTHNFYYRNVAKVEKTGEREVTFHFDRKGVRELPYIVAELMVVPKHWWEGKDAKGRPRNIEETTLEPPLGSGMYRVKSFEPARMFLLERVKGAWAENLPAMIGTSNFDEIRVEHFLDETVQFEAFKADKVDFRFEGVARQWARSYDFPGKRDGKVVMELFKEEAVGWVQGFVLNLRRDKFRDARVRRALNLALDFEELNRSVFFNEYARISSYFFGLEIAATGLPDAEELKVLEPYRDRIPAEVFTKPFENPKGGSPEAMRANLREAVRLLAEAGWVIRQGKLVDAKTSAPFTIEFLVEADSYERILLFYKANIERLGFDVKIRKVDLTQYDNRKRNRDFDLIMEGWGQTLTPGSDQREYWGSVAADTPASSNLAGIKNPVIDELIERIVNAKDRAEELVLIRALDRILLHNHYIVPNWAYFFQRTARWDRFGRPTNMPRYGSASFPTIWWYDREKAAKTGAPR